MLGGRTLHFWQRKFWQEKGRRYRLRRAGAIPPRYHSRKAANARRDAALARLHAMPPVRPTQTIDRWADGRTRVTDFDNRTGRKTRVREVRVRAKGRDGLRPRQRRAATPAR